MPNTAQSHPSLMDRIDQRVFRMLVGRSLVYNTCWEDPAVDREVLRLGAQDDVLVITSAGCNALDYALDAPRSIHAVDANPRQTALLELKMAAIRALPFEDAFALFGEGAHPDAPALYRRLLREQLSPFARAFWDTHLRWFTSARGSFYFHGLSGLAASGVARYLALRPALRRSVRRLFDASDIGEQRAIYDRDVAPHLWNRPVNWLLSRQATMNLLGVPHPQRKLVQAQHADGIAGFIRSSIEYVVRQLPLSDNYFWRVYLTGRYTRDCCPAYLTHAGFAALRDGLVDRIVPHTSTVTDFLQTHDGTISRFVLLDHMDWMSSYYPQALLEEWDAILAKAAPGARILLRSAQERPAYLDAMEIGPQRQRLRDLLHFRDELATSLQPRDRVHTYAGFVIADARA